MVDAFSIEIAGSVFGVQTLFQSTKEYCKAYISNRNPEFFVNVSWADLGFEQMLLEREAIEEGLKIRKFKEPFLERSTIQRRVADCLIERNTLMLHGSTVALDGQAYLFTAPCGTGKSTHTRLWRGLFGDRAVMVNDDKPFLRVTPSGIFACGSPWNGKHGLSTNVCVPLRGICLLRRGEENWIQRADAKQLMDFLRDQVHMPTDTSLTEKSLSLLEQLTKTVPLWEMRCNKEPDAAKVAYTAMSGIHK